MNLNFIPVGFDTSRNIRLLMHYNVFNCFFGSMFVVVYCYYLLSCHMVYEYKACISLCIIIGFIASYLPFYFVQRSTLMYHYIIPLIFIFLLIGTAVDTLPRYNKQFAVSVLVLSTLSFIIFIPLTYPISIPSKYIKLLGWREKWLINDARINII